MGKVTVRPNLGQHGQAAPLQVGHRARRCEAVQDDGEAVGLNRRSRPHGGEALQQGLLVAQQPHDLAVHQREPLRRIAGHSLPVEPAQVVQVAEKGIVLDRLVRLRQQCRGVGQRVVHPGHLLADADGQRVEQVGVVVAAPQGAQRLIKRVTSAGARPLPGQAAGKRLRLVKGGGAAGAVAAVQDHFGQPAQFGDRQGVAVLGAGARHGDGARLLGKADNAEKGRSDHRRQRSQRQDNGDGQRRRHGLQTGPPPGAVVRSGFRGAGGGSRAVGDAPPGNRRAGRRHDVRYRDVARLHRHPIVHSTVPAHQPQRSAQPRTSQAMHRSNVLHARVR
ncbi:hypothetical protein [Azospirillum argentinense]|uniref:hypothetical protein n=1 Tax=Azospirillum argentinense TaxID=2970906 RepID=UPI0018DC836D|nr:hypothetical protein [Azospirillum argentinense]